MHKASCSARPGTQTTRALVAALRPPSSSAREIRPGWRRQVGQAAVSPSTTWTMFALLGRGLSVVVSVSVQAPCCDSSRLRAGPGLRAVVRPHLGIIPAAALPAVSRGCGRPPRPRGTRERPRSTHRRRPLAASGPGHRHQELAGEHGHREQYQRDKQRLRGSHTGQIGNARSR